jgi:DNA-binding NarL/FixJ family response regulator
VSETVTIVVVARDDRDPSDPALASARAQFERRGGRMTTTTDEAVRAHFDSVATAVDAAINVQQDAGAADAAGHRIGIDLGEIDDDQSFATADEAARALAARASAGEIVVSELVRMLLGRRGGIEPSPLPRDEERPDEPAAFVVPWELDETRTSLRVVVADDASLIRSGIVQLLTASGFDVVAEAADADELTTAVDRDPPDLVITDIRMPPGHSDEGLRAAATIRSAHPEVAVLVLSQHIEARAAADLLDGRPAGIGYLLKERVSDLAEFVDACTAVADGGSVIDAMVAERLMRRRANDDVVARLTDRERDVLGAMARGLSNQAIADELYLGKKTIETHVGSIFQKLDLGESGEGNRRVQAVLQFLNARE